MTQQPRKTSTSSLNCYISDSDRIPVVDFFNDPSAFGGQFMMFCENKHVLSFLKNPGDNPPDPSSVSQYYYTLKETYPLFFKNSDDTIFEQFTNIMSLRQLDYWSGTSFAIRLLGESFVYSNYGTYAWYGDVTLKSKTDKDKLDHIYSNVRHLGFGTFIILILSSTQKKDLINRDADFCYKEYKLNGDRYDIAVAAAKNLGPLMDKGPWNTNKSLKDINEVFKTLSPFVHSRELVDPKAIDGSLEKVLYAYEEFYKNGNSWRIIYE